MSTIGMVLTVVLLLLAVVLSIIILMQSKRSAGLGAIGGGASGDTYWSKNKGSLKWGFSMPRFLCFLKWKRWHALRIRVSRLFRFYVCSVILLRAVQKFPAPIFYNIVCCPR